MTTIAEFMHSTMSGYLIILILLTVAECQVLISPTLSSSSSIVVTTTITTGGTVTPVPTPTPTPVTTSQPTTTTACDANPCKNGATCVNLTPTNSNFRCECTGGWKGRTCINQAKGYAISNQLIEVESGSTLVTPNSPLSIRNLITDTTTQFFADACTTMKKFILDALKADGTITLDRIICIKFFFASLHFDYIIEIPDNETATAVKIQEAVEHGYRLTENDTTAHAKVFPDSVSLTDINECANTSSGYCKSTAICTNLIGGYECSCAPTFTLVDGSSCVSTVTGGEDNYLEIILPSVIVGLLLLLLLIFFLLILRKRRKYEPNDEVDSSIEEALEAYGKRRMRASVKPISFYNISEQTIRKRSIPDE